MAVEQAGAAGNVTGQPLSMTQLAGIVSRYFPPEARATAVAIAWHESRGNPNALNDKNNTPAGSRDRGIWQINDHWNPSVTDACAFDPECSTAYAAGLYKTNGWNPWATYKRGAYRPFLEQAEAAVEQADKSPASAAGSGTPGQHSLLPGWVPTPGDVAGGIKDAAGFVVPDSVGDAFKFIAKAFSVLTSGDFWKRVGIAYAGMFFIIVAIVIVKRDTIIGAAAGAAKGGPAGAAVGAAQGEAAGKATATAKKEAKKTADAGADASATRPAGDAAAAGDTAPTK